METKGDQEKRKDHRGRGWESSMLKFRSTYRWLCLALIFCGGLFSLLSESTPAQFSEVHIKSINGVAEKVVNVVSFPWTHFLIEVLGYLFFSMGVAIFIALFISNVIERHERRKWEQRDEELKRSIATSAFEAMYEMVMPKEIFEVIKNDLLQNRVIRRNASWNYGFKIGDDGGIVCERKLDFTLENIGKDKIENPFKISLQDDENSKCELLRIIAECRGIEVAKFDSSDLLSQSGIRIEKSGGNTSACIERTLDSGGDNAISVSTLMKIEFKNVIQGVIFTTLPTINGRLEFSFPAEFDLYFCPSISPEIKEEEYMFHGYRTKSYSFKGGVLPKQGFAFNLSRGMERPSDIQCLKTISAKFAHKLNNAFGPVVSISDSLLTLENLEAHIKPQIEDIYVSGQRAMSVIKDLESFGGHQNDKFEQINLSLFIQECLVSTNVRALYGRKKKVDFITNLDTETLDIRGDRESIKRMFLTMIEFLISRDEEDPKAIRVDVENIYIDRPFECYADIEIGEYVVLRAINSRLRIDKEQLKECFRPFPEHYQAGDMSGLKLTIVSKEIRIHAGYCRLDSDQDGTVFELFFPIIRHRVISRVSTIPISNLMGNRERILVVDDEKRVLETARDMLSALDYQPTLVNSGEKAIELISMGQRYDLVILDMVMPNGLNGAETYKQIIDINPHQKAIIVSGKSESKIREEIEMARQLGAGRYIKKPITFQKLGEAIKAEIGEAVVEGVGQP